MQHLGAHLESVEAGRVAIRLAQANNLTQQHGYLHAGAVASVADSACGYAALSLMPANAAVLTVEFKVNLMAPALGDYIIASGEVIKHGRTLTIAEARVHAYQGGQHRLVASLTATLMTVRDRDIRD